MPSYETIPAAEDGLLATAPKPKTSLKRVLGAAALTSFVLGVVAATAVSSAVGPHTTQLKTKTDAAYITPDCNGRNKLHAKYMSNPIGSGDAGDGWYCVNSQDMGDAPSGFFISAFNQDSFDTAVDTRSYDAASIHSGCGRAAWDSWNGYWHCLDDDDFVAAMLSPGDFAYQASVEGTVTYGDGTNEWTNDLFDNKGSFNSYTKHGKEDMGFDWRADWDGQGAMPVHYSAATEGDWYKLWKYDGSATGFYLAELVCPHSYYDDDHYCAIEFRCYYDDSASGFTYTLHDDC